MKFKLSIFIFMLIFSVLFVNVSCNLDGGPCGPEEPPSPPEPDYLGEHFTNEIVTIPAKTTYNYYNSGKYKNKPEQERVTLYVRSDKDKTRLREVRGRRVIETPILDIYVDLSEYRGVVQKSVNFGLNNWIKLLNYFYDNYQKMIDVYGNHYKGFNGGKIDILFVDLKSFDGGGYVGGYFTLSDIEGHTYGNKRQILYINSRYLVEKDIDDLMHTIFHEFQHLINYSRVKLNLSQSPMHTWLNEALSESTYYITHGDIPNSNRFSGYHNSASIKEGKSFYTWIEESSDSYVASSMFMYWLYLHGGGDKIIKNIANFDRNTDDYYKVVKAVKNNFPFYYQFQVKDWENILLSWYTANFSQSSSGLESYLGKYTFTPQIITMNSIANLAPGEGIYISQYLKAIYTGNNIVQKNLTYGNRKATLVLNKSSSTDTNRDKVYLVFKNGSRSSRQLQILNTKPYLDPKIWIDYQDDTNNNITLEKD